MTIADNPDRCLCLYDEPAGPADRAAKALAWRLIGMGLNVTDAEPMGDEIGLCVRSGERLRAARVKPGTPAEAVAAVFQ